MFNKRLVPSGECADSLIEAINAWTHVTHVPLPSGPLFFSPTSHHKSLLSTLHCTLSTVHSPLSTLHSPLCTLHSPLSTLLSPLSSFLSPLSSPSLSLVRGWRIRFSHRSIAQSLQMGSVLTAIMMPDTTRPRCPFHYHCLTGPPLEGRSSRQQPEQIDPDFGSAHGG